LFDESIEGNARFAGKHGDLSMNVRSNPDIQRSAIRFLWLDAFFFAISASVFRNIELDTLSIYPVLRLKRLTANK